MAKKKKSVAVLKTLSARFDGKEEAKVSDFEEVLVKSKERVKQHGEVFTPANIVNDMLDLVPQMRIEGDLHSLEEKLSYTVLEPTCGNGNFLIEILNRKLKVAFSLPKDDLTINILKAVSTIYGVDIQQDNVIEARERLLQHLIKACKDIGLTEDLVKGVKHILGCNIVWGNTLQYITLEGGATSPLIIYDWGFISTDGDIKIIKQASYLSDLDTVVYSDETYLSKIA